MKCWGANTYGQVILFSLLSFVTILIFCFACDDCFCGLTVRAVQLGDNTLLSRLTPVGVAGLESGVAVVAAGGVGVSMIVCIASIV